MFTFTDSSLEALSVHYIDHEGQTVLTEEGFPLADADLRDLLSRFFLTAFKEEQQYQFVHETDLKYNEMYAYSKAVFQRPNSLHEQSVAMAKHLAAASTHPGIKPGELFTAYFKNLIFDNKSVDGIVLIKAENKKDFLLVDLMRDQLDIQSRKGLDPNKADKACVILNTDSEDGYRLFLIDHTNKGNEAIYWKEDFLNVKECADSFAFTKNFLSVAKEFIVNNMPASFETSKADQAGLLNKSVAYFKENENFNINEFQSAVFQEQEVINSFQEFGSSYLHERNMEIADTFTISPSAVKKQARVFKSVIKLDRNFHIYIHGNRELIEQGYDEVTGKRYYKIYFDQEM
ncbi:MAG: nucleoid-associated protein [Lacibacter sp.]|nr:nucleoid-associated protein [Lacibacter sp.]